MSARDYYNSAVAWAAAQQPDPHDAARILGWTYNRTCTAAGVNRNNPPGDYFWHNVRNHAAAITARNDDDAERTRLRGAMRDKVREVPGCAAATVEREDKETFTVRLNR